MKPNLAGMGEVQTPSIHIEICYDLEKVTDYFLVLETTGVNCPFQSSSWLAVYRATMENSGKGWGEWVFVVVFEYDRPVAIYPFVLVRGWLTTSIRWLAANISDYNGPVVDRDFSARLPRDLFSRVIGSLTASRPEIAYASLTCVPQSCPGLPEHVSPVGRSFRADYDSHALALRRNWREYYKHLRSKDTRQRLHSKLTGLRKAGDFKFARVKVPAKRVEVAEQIMEWKADRLEAAGDRNPFGRPGRETDIRRTILIAVARSDTPIEVFAIYLDGKPVAGMLALLTSSVFHFWVTSFDARTHPRFSVGTLLLLKTIELAARSGYSHYDFLSGDEEYKKDWCDIRIPLWHHLIPFGVNGSLLCALMSARQGVERILARRLYAKQMIRNSRKAAKRFHLTLFWRV
jgi:CelD/BcsL family acetyltransferase involved in cellulose biosynthesis